MSEASLLIAMCTPLILNGIPRLMASNKIRPAYYPLALISSGSTGLAILHATNCPLVKVMLGILDIFTARIRQPDKRRDAALLLPGGHFSLSVAWGNFTTGFFLSFISSGILIYIIARQGGATSKV